MKQTVAIYVAKTTGKSIKNKHGTDKNSKETEDLVKQGTEGKGSIKRQKNYFATSSQ